MAERHPGEINATVDLTPPTEELKLTGSPGVDDLKAKGGNYNVHLPLSRALTEFEYDMVGARETNAGMLYVHDSSRRHLTVVQTTIELVRDWADELKAVVKAIAADGEKDRASSQRLAEEAKLKATEAKGESDRRRKLADEITFD